MPLQTQIQQAIPGGLGWVGRPVDLCYVTPGCILLRFASPPLSIPTTPHLTRTITITTTGAGAGGQWVSPARVRRAVEATCSPLGGGAPDAVLTYGRGLLQVRGR